MMFYCTRRVLAGSAPIYIPAYKTKIGEALLDKKVGDQVEIPGAGTCTIKAVAALPENLRKALACED